MWQAVGSKVENIFAQLILTTTDEEDTINIIIIL